MTLAQLKEINRRAESMPRPSNLAIEHLIKVLECHGFSLSEDEAVDWLRTFAAAEQIGRGE